MNERDAFWIWTEDERKEVANEGQFGLFCSEDEACDIIQEVESLCLRKWKAALASQEPVAWKYQTMVWHDKDSIPDKLKSVAAPLYTSPQSLASKDAEIARLRKALETCTFKKDIGDYGGEYWYDENLVTKALAQGEQNE
jgi:hypothetical protein